jgi:hypothetical protein
LVVDKSARDVVFDEYTIFDGSEKQVIDNLMHSTLEEIQLWIRTVELPPSPQDQNSETNTFYKDEAVSDSWEGPQDQPQYNEAGRKRISYPTPPSTPPAAFIVLSQAQVGWEDRCM